MSATFEQWLEFVFNNPVREPEWYWDEDFDSLWEALELPDTLIVQYMTRLFEEPDALRPYSLDQIEQGLWFLIGDSSPGHSSQALLRRKATLANRVACIHAMSGFFREFVLAATSVDFDPRDNTAKPVECAAFMWWDIFPMRLWRPAYGPPLPPNPEENMPPHLQRKMEIEPEIHEATLRVMADVLELPSELCQFSALHGLGHWHSNHPERVEQIVDAFVTRHKDLKPHLIEYASRARLGSVL